ncbi:MAG: hypothetical protein M1290_05140 [Candidatus Thermoplasmatota archaeon]|nr:hypothetical protein [Candidatus Thermoplasmatota archaeon]MCL5789830.1 hypothetical protein [Candidatus Thermoplasmatota archaeon]
MEIVFPDIPEYHFILKGLYSDKLPSYPRFHCEAITDFNRDIKADVAFLPAPIAMMNARDYVLLKSGNIFSYYSGPQLFSPLNEMKGVFVWEKDLVSEYYAKIFIKGVSIIKGQGYPALVEPRIAMMTSQTGREKIDLYGSWRTSADNLPFPLYCGMIRSSARGLKELVEDAVKASVKYALDNSSEVIKEIAMAHSIENFELLKRVMFQFINKNTFAITEEEIESLTTLNREMENKGFTVYKLKI